MRVYLREAPQKFCLQIDGTSDLCTALDSCALGVATGAVHGIVVPFYAVLHSFRLDGLYFRLKFSDIRGICEGKINGPFRNLYLERMVGLPFFFKGGRGRQCREHSLRKKSTNIAKKESDCVIPQGRRWYDSAKIFCPSGRLQWPNAIYSARDLKDDTIYAVKRTFSKLYETISNKEHITEMITSTKAQ